MLALELGELCRKAELLGLGHEQLFHLGLCNLPLCHNLVRPLLYLFLRFQSCCELIRCHSEPCFALLKVCCESFYRRTRVCLG